MNRNPQKEAAPDYEQLPMQLHVKIYPAKKEGGPLAYRMHRGGHTDVIDWPLFVEWAAKWWE